MARKKKTQEEYVPSKYQKAIFDFVEHGQGNAVIEAEPGAGKSVTATWAVKYIPEDKSILFTAFNTDIVDELKKKLKKCNYPHNIDCKTLHGLGYSLLMSNFGRLIEKTPNDFKYSAYIYNNIREIGGSCYSSLAFKDHSKYIDNVKKFVDLGRCYLAESMSDMNYIETHYSISCFSNEKEVALQVMDWGKENYQTVDFTDMIWLPNVLNCKPYGKIYDWIIADESQDISRAERELILRCTNMSTRMLFLGQKIQSINSFQGADYRSFDELKKLPNTCELPLSISYRCAKNIVKLANRFSPSMQASDDAIDGEVKYNVPIDEVEDGDMVLCRVNAPLLQMYCELAKRNKPVNILGKDIGKNLIKVIEKTKEKFLFVNLKDKGVFSSLYNSLFNEIDAVMKKNKISFEMAMDDMNIAQQYDTIQALEAICGDCNEAECLIETIKQLFSDKKKKGITLSTIHKSKGLEADNVYICCPSLLPAKSAKEQWELQQEANLEFVAYTRAKKKLGFLSEDDFTIYSSNSQQKSSNLQSKKDIIFKMYGSKDRCGVVIPSSKAAKHIIDNSTQIKEKPRNVVDINNNKNNRNKTQSFSDVTSFKKKKVKRKIKI